MGLIQTSDQLKFSYIAIVEGAKQLGHISKDILVNIAQTPPPVNRRSSTSSSSSDDDDDGPPPLPPRRSDSLIKSSLFNGNNDNNIIVVGGDDHFATLPTYLQEQLVNTNTNGHNESSNSSSEPTPPDKMSGLAPPTHQRLVASVSAPLQQDKNHEAGGRFKTDFYSNLGGSTSNTASPTRCILNNHKMEERKR